MKIVAICFALAFSIQIQAEQIRLATITSDTNSDITIFYVETNDDGSAQAMRYVTTTETGLISEDVHNRMEQVLDGGVTLKEMEGREIIRLFAIKFDSATGGKIKLQYLANGVTNSYANQHLQLKKDGKKFALVDNEGKTINTMFVAGNWSRLLRRWIGVSAIITSFDKMNQ
jgi:hypothetical protein